MKERIGIGIGGVSILAIFVVLSLTALAALSFVTAQADYRLAEKTAVSQKRYYEADAAAEQRVADILKTAADGGAWESELLASGASVQKEDGAAEVSFTQEIDGNRWISAVIELQLDAQGRPTGAWARTSWQTKAREPEDEETFNLLK